MILDYVGLYYRAGAPEKAKALSQKLINNFRENLDYYSLFGDRFYYSIIEEVQKQILMYDEVVSTLKMYESDKSYSEEVEEKFYSTLEALPQKYLMGFE
jgi:hypothetical protein